MRRNPLGPTFTALLFLLPGLATAEDLATVSDLDLLQRTREAVTAQDGAGALVLLTEMQSRGIGLFANAKAARCTDEVDLPSAVTDWKFHAVARHAYLQAVMSRQLAAQSCACLFEGFSFPDFVEEALGKPAAELTNGDRAALETIRDKDRRDIEARYRALAQSCKAA